MKSHLNTFFVPNITRIAPHMKSKKNNLIKPDIFFPILKKYLNLKNMILIKIAIKVGDS